jgi:uncharacterized protein YjiS (DUF1127 family)
MLSSRIRTFLPIAPRQAGRRTPILRWAIRLEGWLERRRQRHALLELSDHMLKDIGLSRSEAGREGRKPFWRA